MLYANSLRNNLPETWVPGIKFCSKQILRLGIILYGFRLTFQSVIAVGTEAIVIDMIVVCITIFIGILTGKLLKMDKDLSLLPASVVGFINNFDTFLLTMAMTALGAETSIDKFRQAGAKPFILAAILFIWLMGGGYLLARYLGPLL